MKFNVKVNRNSYLTNCKIIKIIERVRKGGIDGNYDVVEVECSNWQDIRAISFNGIILVPEEFEDNEIVLWKHEELSKNKEHLKSDIQELKNFFELERGRIETFDVFNILMQMEELFETKIRRLEKNLD